MPVPDPLQFDSYLTCNDLYGLFGFRQILLFHHRYIIEICTKYCAKENYFGLVLLCRNTKTIPSAMWQSLMSRSCQWCCPTRGMTRNKSLSEPKPVLLKIQNWHNTMSGDETSASHQGHPAVVAPMLSVNPGDQIDMECPICYQEYNQYNTCPRVLECLHVFCTECLQRIGLCLSDPSDPRSLLAIPCPLCRHLTPLESRNALSLPYDSRTLARLSAMTFRVPVTIATRLSMANQRVAVFMEGDNRDTHFIILPTVSLRVHQMYPERPSDTAPSLVREEEDEQQSKKTLVCVQLLALVFWVLFVIICVIGAVFGPHFFNRKL